jgi:hypothetical protein
MSETDSLTSITGGPFEDGPADKDPLGGSGAGFAGATNEANTSLVRSNLPDRNLRISNRVGAKNSSRSEAGREMRFVLENR